MASSLFKQSLAKWKTILGSCFYKFRQYINPIISNTYMRMLEDDPLKYVSQFLTFGVEGKQKKIKKIVKIYFLVSLVWTQVTVLVGGMLIWRNDDWNIVLEYLLSITLLEPGCATMFLMYWNLDRIYYDLPTTKDSFCKLNIADEILITSILQRARKYNAIIFTLIAWTTINCLIHIPYKSTDAVYMVANSVYPYPRIMITCVVPGGLWIVYGTIYLLYYTFHISTQRNWLNWYIERNLMSTFGNSQTNFVRNQEEIYYHLVNVVKFRKNIRRNFDKLTAYQNLTILLLGITGLLAAVACAAFILLEIKPALNWKFGVTISTIIAIAIMLSISGQNISDESLEMNTMLYNCPWFYWNIKNRRALLLILNNTDQPWQISFYNVFPIDHMLLLKGSKLLYTLVAVCRKFQ